MRSAHPSVAHALSLALLAAPGAAVAASPIHFQAAPGDPGARPVEQMLPDARRRVEGFFGQPFREPLNIKLAPIRAAFNAAFPPAWGMSQTECWMVGVGVADFLVVLSPADWAKEACDHKADDSRDLRGIVTHELVHMYHGQHNPTRDFSGADDIGWFVEGLAVLASGQLDETHAGDAAEAIRKGQAPTALGKAWSGQYRYGVCGSLVRYIDQAYGRKTIIALLPAKTPDEVLGRLGLSEAEFLARWKAWVLAGAPAGKASKG